MGVQQFIFKRSDIDHQHNLRRWYVITWGPTLFGTWAVVRTWGRLGTDWSRQQVDEFDTANEAMAEVRSQVERRGKRGYIAV